MKKIAIIQSSYIPWKGYFDLINSVDECVIYDDVQYTRRDWRNRNQIKTKNGLLWLSIPIQHKGNYHQKIDEILVLDNSWCDKHWDSIRHAYSNAPFFSLYKDRLESAFKMLKTYTKLSEINFYLIKLIVELLGIKTEFTFSKKYGFSDLKKTERLVAICKEAKATSYLSGPSASSYIDPLQFSHANIKLEYISYDNYLPYPQIYGSFVPAVTVLDLLFHAGTDFKQFMKSFFPALRNSRLDRV